jgi:hypothetical protein
VSALARYEHGGSGGFGSGFNVATEKKSCESQTKQKQTEHVAWKLASQGQETCKKRMKGI